MHLVHVYSYPWFDTIGSFISPFQLTVSGMNITNIWKQTVRIPHHQNSSIIQPHNCRNSDKIHYTMIWMTFSLLRFGPFKSGRDKLVLWDQNTLRSEMTRSRKCFSHVIKMSSHITRWTGCTKLKNKIEMQRNEIERKETILRRNIVQCTCLGSKFYFFCLSKFEWHTGSL